MFAAGIDSVLSIVVAVVAVAIASRFLPTSASLVTSVATGFLCMLLRDSLPRVGSIGKRIAGLEIVSGKESPRFTPVRSALRNTQLAGLVYLTLVLSDAELRHSVVLSTMHLVLVVATALDVVYLRRTGQRLVDALLGRLIGVTSQHSTLSACIGYAGMACCLSL